MPKLPAVSGIRFPLRQEKWTISCLFVNGEVMLSDPLFRFIVVVVVFASQPKDRTAPRPTFSALGCLHRFPKQITTVSLFY